jgi:phage terminase large subunit
MAASTPLRILCAREFQVSIGESVHKLISDQISRLGLGYLYDVGKAKITSACGSEFIFAGIRNNPTKIKSTEGVDICWLEEADNISQTSWEVLIPTIRKRGSEIWVSFNPKDEIDPTYQRFIVNPPPDATVLKINWDDNPWFPEELRKEKDYLYSVDPEAAEHVWGGDVRRNSDAQVLKGKCVVEGFEPEILWNGPYYGVDWGFSVDPTAMVKCWVFDGILYIEEEAYGIGIEIDHLPAFFESVSGSKSHVCRADNARPETISYMQRNGYPRMVAVDKWGGCVEDSVEMLRSFRQIVIHPRCTHFAIEARLWSYKTDRVTGDVLPVLASGHDHLIDSCRYAITPLIKRREAFSEVFDGFM